MRVNIMKSLMIVTLGVGLSQCQEKPKAPSPYTYDVLFEFTPAASAKMQTVPNEISVSAFYYGLAKPEYASEADDRHRIRLGYESLIWPGTVRRVHMPVEELDTSLLPKIVDGQALVLLNAFVMPSKGSHPDGFVRCRAVVVGVLDARAKPPVMNCDVAGGV